ncbi:porin family protein [Dysgonomonas sp. 511]|uniref:porin family protein n=1 Tax=Dysgonomonas sp. 511 TaxID=2302930 RepID=UPI0013CFD573|nr:porin family protein [Dysgonomonas sp. 511]NDV79931.1 porin family protein [Dysgonomonas sp. 511]
MKKLIFTLVLSIVCIMGAMAQTGAKYLMVKAGYQTEAERFGIGVEGRYYFTENIRFSPDVIFYFPNNHTTGLDININANYVFPIQGGFSLYPTVGLAIINNRFSHNGHSNSSTDLGFNLGAGADYMLSGTSYLNFDIKYTFNDDDFMTFMVGYGFRF